MDSTTIAVYAAIGFAPILGGAILFLISQARNCEEAEERYREKWITLLNVLGQLLRSQKEIEISEEGHKQAKKILKKADEATHHNSVENVFLFVWIYFIAITSVIFILDIVWLILKAAGNPTSDTIGASVASAIDLLVGGQSVLMIIVTILFGILFLIAPLFVYKFYLWRKMDLIKRRFCRILFRYTSKSSEENPRATFDENVEPDEFA